MTLARLPLAIVALAAGCAWSGDRAEEIYQAEVARDLGAGSGQELLAERDDDDALAAGQRLAARAAADPTQPALTLAECFRLAIAGSEQLRARAEQIFAADMQRREAIAGVLPQVALYGSHNKDSNPIGFGGGGSFQSSERTSYGLTITQTIFDGQLGPRLAIVAETRRIQALTLRDERDQLLFAVASDFYEALGLEADLDAIEATRANAEEALRVLEAREELGLARVDDVLLARASVAEAEARAIQTEADLTRVRARLSNVIGRAPLPRLVDTYEVVPDADSVPRLIDLALRQRSDLEAARRRVEEARGREDLALTDFLPDAELTFDYVAESEEGFRSQLDWTLGLNLTWKLFEGGGTVARVAQARSAIRVRQLELRALEERVRLEVEDAALAFRSLDRALFAFSARARAASAAHAVTQELLAVGSATQLELLVARDTREAAARNLTRTSLGRKLAALRIRLAAGDLRNARPAAELAEHP